MKRALHPSEQRLALYAGGDLGAWEQWRAGRHILNCPECRGEVEALREGIGAFRETAAEMPGQANWPRLSEEITANIHLGLEAGECIAGFEKAVRPSRPRLFWHTASLLAAATAVVLVTLWMNLPKAEVDHLMGALGQIRWERIGLIHAPVLVQDAVVLEAGPSAIEVKVNGRALTLMHPRSAGATVSVNMQDSAGVRYVDTETGQVTMNRVYYVQ